MRRGALSELLIPRLGRRALSSRASFPPLGRCALGPKSPSGNPRGKKFTGTEAKLPNPWSLWTPDKIWRQHPGPTQDQKHQRPSAVFAGLQGVLSRGWEGVHSDRMRALENHERTKLVQLGNSSYSIGPIPGARGAPFPATSPATSRT